MTEERLVNLSAVIREWVLGTQGWFSSRQLDNDIGIETSKAKNLRRVTLKRLVDDGTLLRAPQKDGVYRLIEGDLQEVDWQDADLGAFIKLKFPFEIEKYAMIYPKSIIAVAGGKDAGKTSWLYDFVLRNMYHPLTVDLFNSETGPEQMKGRFSKFNADIPKPAPFRVYQRMDSFADVIEPDHISVIDYLDLNSEVYLIGEEIDAIFRKLNKGIAVIGLQKPPPSVTYERGEKKVRYRDLAYGSGFTAKRAALYISMDGGKLKLVVVKTPTSSTVNPINKMWSYEFKDGVICNVKDYREGGQEGF